MPPQPSLPAPEEPQPGRLKCPGDEAKLCADIITKALPERAKGDPVLKRILFAAGIVAAMALAAEAAQVDAAAVEKLKAGAERGDAAAQAALGGMGTTGMIPAGHIGAWGMVRACCAASLAQASGSMIVSKISKPRMAPGAVMPVWFSVALEAMATTLNRVYTRVSPVNSPSLLAIHTRCTLSV